jgi:hypothetical protein
MHGQIDTSVVFCQDLLAAAISTEQANGHCLSSLSSADCLGITTLAIILSGTSLDADPQTLILVQFLLVLARMVKI